MFTTPEFNAFSSRILLLKTTLQDFLSHNYKPTSNDVFWLDYTDLRYERITEFETILRAVMPGSVVRITLKAESEIDLRSVEDNISSDEFGRLQTQLTADFNRQFDQVLTEPVKGDIFVKPSEYARTVQLMLRRAASLALGAASKVEYVPLQSSRYTDGTQMLSVTGIICKREDAEQVRKDLAGIRFPNLDWHVPDWINVPALSLKERLHLETV